LTLERGPTSVHNISAAREVKSAIHGLTGLELGRSKLCMVLKSESVLEKSVGASASNTTAGSIDFSEELYQLSYQRSETDSIVSPSGIVNFAALYLEVARKGPEEALKMIRR
jgi:hypothetical protein